MSGAWQVPNYQDSVREVTVSTNSGWARYFATREKACDFIVERAEQAVEDAETELKSARRRLLKCQNRFAPRALLTEQQTHTEPKEQT